MVKLEADNPGELRDKIRWAYGVALGVYEHEEAAGRITDGRRNPLQELRVEYQGRCIPLTEEGLATLCEFQSGSEYARNLQYLKKSPPFSWGCEQAGILERELIPAGLLEVDPKEYSMNVYRLSALAREGRYIAVVDETAIQRTDPYRRRVQPPFL